MLKGKNWILSPAYDLNPNKYGDGLSLNITDTDNSLHLDLAMEVANFLRLSDEKAGKIINHVSTVVSKRRDVATKYKISKADQERIATAFE